jgi:peptidoglycan/LPS O-acetylase OafA/YrhL
MKLLKRVTASGNFIPYIDGLRFFAIMAVVLSHFLTYYEDRVAEIPAVVSPILIFLFGSSFSGVMLFFGISGFILGLPFVKQHAYQGKKVKLKDYLFRRITRLEPPYIIVLTLLFGLNLVFADKGGFSELLPHYLASFFYLHNIIYDAFPVLNPVFWSLEVEIQFYLLAPLFALVFKLNRIPRRIFLIAFVFIWKFLLQYNPIEVITLINYLSYFIVGFLSADLYLEYKDRIKPSIWIDLLCIASVILFWNGVRPYGIDLIYLLIILTLTGSSIYLKKFLSIPLVYIIGGMCYTIYMLHQRVMYLVLDRFMQGKIFLDNTYADFTLRLVFILIVIGIVSSIFFIFVERPTMKREWWKYRSLRKLFLE